MPNFWAWLDKWPENRWMKDHPVKYRLSSLAAYFFLGEIENSPHWISGNGVILRTPLFGISIQFRCQMINYALAADHIWFGLWPNLPMTEGGLLYRWEWEWIGDKIPWPKYLRRANV